HSDAAECARWPHLRCGNRGGVSCDVDSRYDEVTMRAVRLHKIGEQFQVEQVPDPSPPPGGAVVRLETAALNHRDEYIRVGLYARIQVPAILGSDGAGVVESVAPGVDQSWIGRKVVISPFDDWGPNPRVQ